MPGVSVVVAPVDPRAAQLRQRPHKPDSRGARVDAHPRRHEAAGGGRLGVQRSPAGTQVPRADHELRALQGVRRRRRGVLQQRRVEERARAAHPDRSRLAGRADERLARYGRVGPPSRGHDAAGVMGDGRSRRIATRSLVALLRRRGGWAGRHQRESQAQCEGQRPASSREATTSQALIHGLSFVPCIGGRRPQGDRDEETVCASLRNDRHRGAGPSLRGTSSGRQAPARPRPQEHPPDGLRAWLQRVGRPIRVAETALHGERISGRLRSGVRVRLDLFPRVAGRRPSEARQLHRPGEAGDRPQPGRSPRPLAGHRHLPDLPQQLSGARGERRPLREHRRCTGGLAAGRRPDPGHLGGQGNARSLDRRGDQRDRPQPDPRPVGDLTAILRRDVQILHRPGAQNDRHRPRSTARSRSPDGRCCSRRTSAFPRAPR